MIRVRAGLQRVKRVPGATERFNQAKQLLAAKTRRMPSSTLELRSLKLAVSEGETDLLVAVVLARTMRVQLWRRVCSPLPSFE